MKKLKKYKRALPYAISTYITNTASVMNGAGGEHVPFKDILNAYITDEVDSNLDGDLYYALNYLMGKTEQNAHLLPKRLQERYYKERGYDKNNSSKIKDLFKTKIGGRRVNTYRLNKDVINRNKLKHVGNIHGLNDNEFARSDYKYLSDPLSHSAAIYVDKKGNYYFNAADFNDYGDNDMKAAIEALINSKKFGLTFNDNGGSRYGKAQIFAELADIVGNPAVIETGIVPLSKDQARFIRDYYYDDENMVKHMNAYIGDKPDELTYNGGQIDPVSITAPSKKKYGGKLRYGWGGIMSKHSRILDMAYNPRKYDLTPANFNLSTSISEKNNDYSTNVKRVSNGGVTGVLSYLFPKAMYNLHESIAPIMGRNDIYDIMDVWSDWAPDASYDHAKNKRILGRGWGNNVNIGLDSVGMNALSLARTHELTTVENIKDRLEQDMLLDIKNNDSENFNQDSVSRYGGLLKPKFNYGGYYNNSSYIPINSSAYLDHITAEDIEDSKANYGLDSLRRSTIGQYASSGASIGGGIGALIGTGATILGTSLASGAAGAAGGAAAGAAGGAAAGAAGGAAAGAATGAASTAWIPYIGPIVALVAAAAGAGIGAAVGNKKGKALAEKQMLDNKYYIAQNQNLHKQTTMANVLKRYDSDMNRMNNFKPQLTTGFYSKYGGLLGTARRKFDMGGILEPISSDTILAHGRTHEEMDPITGQTGISYKGAEIEDNEVVQETPQGDKVFSDSIISPRTGLTYAKNAEKISKSKGILEKLKTQEMTNLNSILERINKGRLSGAKLGTLMRNGEKKATHINRLTGEIFEKDLALDNLFNEQEQIATTLGLRDNAMMRYGGCLRKQYPNGGWIAPLVSFASNGLTSGLQYWATSNYNKHSQSILDMLEKEQVPRQVYDEPILLNPEYDITPELEEINRTAAYSKKFISDNIVNPQQRRNLMSKVGIEALQQINKLKGIKKAEEKKIVDANIKEIGITRRSNRQKDYEYNVNKYNNKTNIALRRLQVQANKTQATQQLLRDLGQSATQAAQMYVASKQWAPGVTRDMNGNIISSDFSGMSDKQLKRNKYSKVISRGSDGTMIVAKDLFRGYNTTLAKAWFEEMVSRKLFSGMQIN